MWKWHPLLGKLLLTLSLPEWMMESCKVVWTFESVDKILWCDHSNETSLAVLSHCTICLWAFYNMKFGNFVEYWLWPLLEVKGLKKVLRGNPHWHGQTHPLNRHTSPRCIINYSAHTMDPSKVARLPLPQHLCLPSPKYGSFISRGI